MAEYLTNLLEERVKENGSFPVLLSHGTKMLDDLIQHVDADLTDLFGVDIRHVR